jgi:hypothetical protein
MINTDKLLAQLTRAVSYAYKQDATSPGVLVSSLKDGSVYTSIVRYASSFPKGKKVMFNAKGATLNEALDSLIENFLKGVSAEMNPIDSLRNLVQNDN